MKKVKFDNIDLHEQYKLIYSYHQVSEPIPKTMYIDIPFSSGSVDLTNAISENTTYEDITIELVMGIPLGRADYDTFKTSFKNDWLGGRIEKIDIDNNGLVYKGRVVGVSFAEEVSHLLINVSLRCYPYRFKSNVTSTSFEATPTQQIIILTNQSMPTTPVITVSGDTFIKYGTRQWSINEGTHKLAIALKKGDNEVTIQSLEETNVTVNFQYQEGAL